jgi:hypothetical protein
MTELTETDYGTLALALGKCRLMQDFTKDGDFKLCLIAKKNIPLIGTLLTMVPPFGFPEMSDDEMHDLVQKLDELQKIAWFKEQPKEI